MKDPVSVLVTNGRWRSADDRAREKASARPGDQGQTQAPDWGSAQWQPNAHVLTPQLKRAQFTTPSCVGGAPREQSHVAPEVAVHSHPTAQEAPPQVPAVNSVK